MKERRSENTGKFLGINEDGYVVPQTIDMEGGITEETDPTLPNWARQPNKPAYTAEEVGALSIYDVATNEEAEEYFKSE